MLTLKEDVIPPMKKGRWNTYKAEDILRWGVERFIDETAPHQPIPIPDLGFTEAENQRMNEVLNEDKAASIDDI